MSITPAELLSPADADMFRMTVDYGRWYIDPLPTCPIAEATEDRWPSCSTVKKAADKDWSFLTVNRMASLEPAELHRIADLDHTQRGDAIRSHEKLAKNTAFGRGTIVHLWAEDLAEHRDPRVITDAWLASNNYPVAARTEALIYQAAMVDFFDTYQPELVAKEYVTIHRTLNGHGYGATPDGLYHIPRLSAGIVAVDWKTRGETSSHAAYAEEASQIACGARAEYMIVREGDHAERRPMPEILGGYVVSIRPDGARLYPVDIDKAWQHWCNLHEWWTRRLDEKASIGRVLPKRSAPTDRAVVERTAGEASPSPATNEDWRFEAKRRYDTLNDQQRADYTARKTGIDTSDRDAVFRLLDAVDPIQTSVHEPAPLVKLEPHNPPTAPDEGGPVSPADVAALQARFEALSTEAKLWTGTLIAQGNRAHPFRIRDLPSVRRYELYRGILALAEAAVEDDNIVRGLLYGATGREEVAQEGVPLGAAISTLNATEAAQFAVAAQAYTQIARHQAGGNQTESRTE